jgi:hypothetical protein
MNQDVMGDGVVLANAAKHLELNTKKLYSFDNNLRGSQVSLLSPTKIDDSPTHKVLLS